MGQSPIDPSAIIPLPMEPNSQRKRRHRRRRNRKSRAQSATTIESLSDDVLAEILVWLPSPASLGRAALACPRSWRAHAGAGWPAPPTSSAAIGPSILHHRSSGASSSTLQSLQPDSPCFTANFPDRDLAAVVRGGDFFFTSFLEGDQWILEDCCDGLLLLRRRRDQYELAVFDPVSRCRVRIPFPPDDELSEPEERVLCLLPFGGDVYDGRDVSFQVLYLDYRRETGLLRARVYSSCTGEWGSQIEITCVWPWELGNHFYSLPPMHAAGRIYWKCDCSSECKVLLSLNTETMEYSHVALPPVPGLSSWVSSYAVWRHGGRSVLPGDW